MQRTQAAHPVQVAQPAAHPPLSAAARLISGPWLFLAVAALALLLLLLLPPLLSVNRYQHRISTGIGASLGRPVHFDHVSLNLLPLPGFTITNFVVEEDPAFGDEPTIRANTVRATLRVRSLWSRRIEFSRITFIEPSVNLVHNSSGKWNVEAILLQAARIESAPTAQAEAGSTPRFPYIEATGARLNLKQGIEKTPFSLSEADLALWQPDPRAWKMRLEGRPIRTDTSVSGVGSFQVEATLGRAANLESVPLDLQASWRDTPLGEASRLLLARDLGLRGEITLTANIHGDLTRNTIESHLNLSRLRRSDFVPEQTISLDVECSATGLRLFHTIDDLRCTLPLPDAAGATLALAGSLPDVLHLGSADLQVGTARLPASVLLSWLRVASSRMPPSLSATGLLSGSLAHEPGSTWIGQATIPDLHLSGSTLGAPPESTLGTTLNSTLDSTLGTLSSLRNDSPSQDSPGSVARAESAPDLANTAAPSNPASPAPMQAAPSSLTLSGMTISALALRATTRPPSAPPRHLTSALTRTTVILDPVSLPLGSPGSPESLGSPGSPGAPGPRDPAILEGSADSTGYTLHLSGAILPSRLHALATAIPQIGDGLSPVLPADLPAGRANLPVHLDISARRTWGGDQVWVDNLARRPGPSSTPAAVSHLHRRSLGRRRR